MPANTPWKDNKWLPGVLNKTQMEALIDANILINADKKKIGNTDSALDLHLSGVAYRMETGSIKPIGKKRYLDFILNNVEFAKPHQPVGNCFELRKGECYVFLIQEKLSPEIKASPIYGQATAKSSVGRVDVIARLIVDGMGEYETFSPEYLSTTSGQMFLEITPITFNVKVRQGSSISQLRFFNGKIEDSLITNIDFINSVLFDSVNHNKGTLSVDVSKSDLPNNEKAVAFCAVKKDKDDFIELYAAENTYNPNDYWEIKPPQSIADIDCLEIEKNRFYILRSKERISLPHGVCIYCRAMDETLGEMRIHYAGFVHPGFGLERGDGRKGTPLIFEVRGHNVNVLLTQCEILARLFFYRMSEEAIKSTIKTREASEAEKSGNENTYNEQELNLSKFFKKWGTA